MPRSSGTSLLRCQLLEPLGDLFGGRSDGPAHDSAVAQEDECRPELDAEGPAQRAAGPVLDIDVPHLRMPLQEGR